MSLIGVPPSSSSRLTIQLTPFATDEAVPVNPGNGRTPQYGSRISTCDLRLSGRLGGLSGLPDMGQPPRDHVLVRTIGSEAAAEARIGAGLALSLIHISEPTRLGMISYAVFCLKKKNNKTNHTT